MDEGPLIIRRTADQPSPILPEAPDGRLCTVINELEDSFTFGDDAVPGLRALEYVRDREQWCSVRKLQNYLDLGLEDMMQKYREAEA
jgi:hypothetical protein